jgi:Tfp pilus assembly protein PilF
MSRRLYSIPVLFGLGYLYIHLHQPQKAEHYLRTLCLLDRNQNRARVLLAVSMIMQGKNISAELFNHIRRHASQTMVMMLAKRIQRT